MHIGIVNGSKLVSDSDVSWIVRACDAQARDFARDWGLAPWPVIFYKKIEDLPNAHEVRPIVFSDGAGAFKELGYHSFLVGADYIYGRVFVQTIYEYDGGVLGEKDINISDVTSHEVLEMRGNPYLQEYVIGPVLPEGRYYAKEASDVVQRHKYSQRARLVWGLSKDVAVSNYILPDWWNMRSTHGPYDRMGVLDRPFSIADGGYAIVKDDIGRRSEVYARVRPPEWLMSMKRDVGSRTSQIGSDL